MTSLTDHRHRRYHPPRWFRQLALLIAIATTACAVWAFIEARLLLVSRATVSSPQLPAELSGVRIAFVTDIHSGDLLGRKRIRRVVDEVNALDADVIVLGGDNIGGGEHGNEWFYEEAARLHAPLGVYAVLGNHDGRWSAREARAKLPKAGIVLLENDSVRLRYGGGGLRLSGVADLFTGSPDFRAVAEGTRKDGYAIVVSHNPDALVTGLPETNHAFDLALSGHNHGGQVTLFGLYAPVMPTEYGQRFRGGWTTVEGVPTLVSRGAGVFVLPVRFFAPPEIHLIELRQGRAELRTQ